MPNTNNYTYLSGLVTGFLTTVGVAGALGWVIWYLGAKWADHVNKCLNEIFERFRQETKEREERWRLQHMKCDAHTSGLAELKGRMEGAKK